MKFIRDLAEIVMATIVFVGVLFLINPSRFALSVWEIIQLIFIMVLCIFLHELGHAVMAIIHGVKVKNISLLGVEYDQDGEKSSDHPSIILIALSVTASEYYFIHAIAGTNQVFIVASVLLGFTLILNTLPMPPLDGGIVWVCIEDKKIFGIIVWGILFAYSIFILINDLFAFILLLKGY